MVQGGPLLVVNGVITFYMPPTTSYKWGYNPYKWPLEWITGVITLIVEL